MTAKRRICVVTGSRADYGLLRWVMKEIDAHPLLILLTAATGMHLSPEFGLTYREIESDGFRIDARVESLLSGDTPTCVAKSVGLGTIGFADAFARMAPDFVLLLGDRFEIFAAAQAAYLAGIPLGHIAGGDTTEGAYDEALRHGITKMAHLHFVTNDAAARRVQQLGEHPSRIHNFGSPGIDAIRHMDRVSRDELERRLGFKFLDRNILVTFHPATLDASPATLQFGEIIKAIDALGPAVGILLTRSNADTGGRALSGMIDDFIRTHPNARAYASLGSHLYLNTMAQVDAVVGNSSSALYEAPSLRIPAVNIGDRQKGRPQASSVINCSPAAADILRAIRQAFGTDCSRTVNPYGDGFSATRIVSTLVSIDDPKSLLRKEFLDQLQ
jgi:UDP-N-acetylglucosamine 2-epimerase (non-hydrolysing)/GDP/UDP-N,N'-diacetylbacillosamine 2-epimerase (hydrolysing)